MAELIKIRSDLFSSLYDAFLHDDDPLSDEQDWRNIFDYQWEKDEDYSGYALRENQQIIGMMSMAFSQREIAGEIHKFCNLHTWWVHPEHRGKSVTMLRPLVRMQDYTLTHFTPCDRVRALTKRLGFVDLNLQMRLLLPLKSSVRDQRPNVDLAFDDELNADTLPPRDRRIHDDHLPYRVGNLLINDSGESCYILYTHVVRYRVNYCHIHYIGNRRVYQRNEATVRQELMKRHGVRFVVLDSRLVKDLSFRRSVDFWAPAHAVFRPVGGITEQQVDNLYSDVVMLRLAILPHISHELKKMARRLLPFSRS